MVTSVVHGGGYPGSGVMGHGADCCGTPCTWSGYTDSGPYSGAYSGLTVGPTVAQPGTHGQTLKITENGRFSGFSRNFKKSSRIFRFFTKFIKKESKKCRKVHRCRSKSVEKCTVVDQKVPLIHMDIKKCTKFLTNGS